MFYYRTTIDDLVAKGKITVVGDKYRLQELFTSLDNFDPSFPIVTPVNDK